MKAVFITNIPAPYQVKFCSVLKDYGDVYFIFCDRRTDDRPNYWDIPLGSNCMVLNPKKKHEFGNGRYLNTDITSVLGKIDPDVVMAGGFSIVTNYIAYRWSVKHNRKFVICSEISQKPENLKIYKLLYGKLNALLACGIAAVDQYKKVFNHIPVYNFSYPADLEKKYAIKREYQIGKVRFLYASRFVKNFAPKECLESFCQLYKKYKNISLLMSSYGPLLAECEKYVRENQLEEAVEFRVKLNSWEDVNQLFEDSDILLYPARFAGWGLVVPEAMAAGMPVVTTRNVGASDLLDKEQIISPDAQSIYKAMEKYIMNHNYIKSEGEQNRVNSRSQEYHSKAQELISYFNEIYGI